MNSLQDKQRPDQREWTERETVHPVVSSERARQGTTGHNVRFVLGFGTAAIILAFVIIYLIYFA